jgi:bifunctional lysine-specific demethylase and histidyl-hydroxylase MINA
MEFADLIAPLSRERFLAEHRGRAPLHLGGRTLDPSPVMSWPILSELLNMTGIWGAASLQLALDTRPVPPEAYCRPAQSRDRQTVLQPDAARVKRFLRQGASLVVNDIDTLTPGLRRLADSMERALGGKVQANLYCSWAAHQAFDSHFDTHEVYALHIAGHKRWRVYQGRLEWPIAHPAYKELDQTFHSQSKGPVALEPLLAPGDLLYIPRGQYHDALAESEGTIHVAFGVTYPIGFDVLGLMQDFAVRHALVRQDLPAPGTGGDDLPGRVAALGDLLARTARDPEFLRGLEQFRAGFRFDRGGFDLPGDAARSWRRKSDRLSVARSNGQPVLAGPRGAVPIPPGLEAMVEWVIARERFSERALAAAFPDRPEPAIKRFLGDMQSMHVVEPD